jgi:hypothetical protein
VEKLRERSLTVNADEATIMGLGIFEDTGGFTFKSTTEHDFEAAAWLRTMGMDLDVIRDIMSRELSTEQVAICPNSSIPPPPTPSTASTSSSPRSPLIPTSAISLC